MKPLPAPQAIAVKTSDGTIPSLPMDLTLPTGSFPKGSRPLPPSPLPRLYPWLLVISTAIAALFCLMYITKPVILSSSPPSPLTPASIPKAPAQPVTAMPGGTSTQAGLMPHGDRLPGERSASPASSKPAIATPRLTLPSPPSVTAFEETNLRIQHIMTAEAPGGFLARIDLDVPVIYQSRNLRWTPQEVADARELIVRLTDYQEKSKRLRAEGGELLGAWNRLMDRSLPAKDLRADSPSLPSNQEDTADTPRPAALITTESIQIQPAGK